MEYILENLVKYIGDNMTDIKMVDEDYGQLEMLDDPNRDTYPLAYPAILIDAPDTSWSNDGQLNQRGVCTVKAKLIIDCYDDTHYTSGTVEAISERDKIRKRMYLLLQGHRIGDSQALIRTNSRFYTYNHGIKVYEETYTVMVTEYVTSDRKPIPGPIKVKIAPTVISIEQDDNWNGGNA